MDLLEFVDLRMGEKQQQREVHEEEEKIEEVVERLKEEEGVVGRH